MEEATLAKIATESLKPISSIIDTLLSAKLQRIKIWAEKQENINRLNHYETNALLNEYLRRLLRKVCGITTIVFPQHSLPLTSIYEPLSVIEKIDSPFDSSEEKVGQSFNAKELEMGCNYIISDSAGMGKSTFVKHLTLEILNSTIQIPIFLELRRVNESESLLQKISKDIDETQNDVNEKILLMLLEQGGFVIILDGYDEISDHARKRIGEEISEMAIRYDQNSIILTTRPEANLPEMPNSKVFNIAPLKKQQAESLVLRYDAVANVDVGQRLISQFDKVAENFLRTPLLVALLYRTYGFNQSIATKVTSFYDDIFNALYKGHDLTKSGFAREKLSKLEAEEFRRLLRGFSFLLAVRQKNNIRTKTEGAKMVEEAINLTSVHPVTAESFFEDLLLTVPLFVRDGIDFRFIHKSLQEFFAAEFLATTINSEKIITKILDSSLYRSFINTFEYLADINPSLFCKLIVAPLAKKVLSEKKTIKNPYIRTAYLLNKIQIGLWPYSKYTKKTRDGVSPNLPDSSGSFSTTFYYGKIKNRKYIFAVRSFEKNRLPFAAWKLITKNTGTSNRLEHFDYDFSSLESVFPAEKWLQVTNKKISNSDNPILNKLISNTLWMGFIRQGNEVRVIDEDCCKDVLRQVGQELDTEKWLTSFLIKK